MLPVCVNQKKVEKNHCIDNLYVIFWPTHNKGFHLGLGLIMFALEIYISASSLHIVNQVFTAVSN